jgi:putative ABC transport system ATP-binding protein
MRMTVALEGQGLVKTFVAEGGVTRAVDGVDIHVDSGEMVSLMGPSGCGKSTLLHLLGGLDRPDEGSISIAGSSTDGLSEAGWSRLRRRHVGFVFQAFHLVDELSAVENVELPALLVGMSRGAARRRAMELLDEVGVADRARHLPQQLSGGQQQRVAIARALINSPAVILADEPTGSLDSASTNDILVLLASMRTRDRAILLVTHDPRVATTADRLLIVRDGRIVDETALGPRGPHPLAGLVEFND